MFIHRNNKGATSIELAASMVVVIPLVLTILFIGVELVHAHMITTVLNQAAEQASRELALQYGQDSTIDGNKGTQDALIFDKIRSNGIINASEQFEEADFATNADPKTVTVTVHYTGGQYGLSPFPSPDPLNLAASFHLSGKATYRLE